MGKGLTSGRCELPKSSLLKLSILLGGHDLNNFRIHIQVHYYLCFLPSIE